MSELRTVELLFLLLLLFIIGFGQIARKIGRPYPIVMIVGGLLLGFVPWIPKITFDPDLIFLVVLPPLVYSSAWMMSWREFRLNLVSILSLAFGLVGFTVVGVALVTPRLLTGFDWRLGLVLGAIVAPTDAIAATSIARKVGLPSRIVDVLEGESLINDATGLLALQFAVALVVSREIPTVSDGLLTLLWLVVGGVAIGLGVGWIVYYAERRIDDGPIEIAMSVVAPYAAYFIADAVHASGVLAVVATGLFLTRRSATMFSPVVRLQVVSFWESFTFILNGLVFVLIGLQLRGILAAIREYSMLELVRNTALFSATLLLLRLLWVFPSSHISYFLQRRLDGQAKPALPPRQIFVIGWTGMRGGLSLAAALALPAVMASGSPFPERNFIVFLTFCVILVTLVLQGLTLPALVRALGLGGSGGSDCEEREARCIALQAAVAHLESTLQKHGAEPDEVYEDVMGHYRRRLQGLDAGAEVERSRSHRRFVELTHEGTKVERETAIRLRNEGRINDQVLRRLERELDLTESKYAKALED